MDSIQHKPVNTYEETIWLNARIASILSSDSSDREKSKKLHELQANVSPLSQSHIDYYLKKIKAKQRSLYSRIASIPLVLTYLFYIIYRLYYFIHPEPPHGSFSLGLTQTHSFLLVCLIPVLILASYSFRYYLTRKK